MLNLALSLAAVNAAGGEFNYKYNGADWPELEGTECGGTNQSPIDLKTKKNYLFDYPCYNANTDDKHKKVYSNQDNVQVNWKGHTS